VVNPIEDAPIVMVDGSMENEDGDRVNEEGTLLGEDGKPVTPESEAESNPDADANDPHSEGSRRKKK
jgi:hypothetical protein